MPNNTTIKEQYDRGCTTIIVKLLLIIAKNSVITSLTTIKHIIESNYTTINRINTLEL